MESPSSWKRRVSGRDLQGSSSRWVHTKIWGVSGYSWAPCKCRQPHHPETTKCTPKWTQKDKSQTLKNNKAVFTFLHMSTCKYCAAHNLLAHAYGLNSHHMKKTEWINALAAHLCSVTPLCRLCMCGCEGCQLQEGFWAGVKFSVLLFAIPVSFTVVGSVSHGRVQGSESCTTLTCLWWFLSLQGITVSVPPLRAPACLKHGVTTCTSPVQVMERECIWWHLALGLGSLQHVWWQSWDNGTSSKTTSKSSVMSLENTKCNATPSSEDKASSFCAFTIQKHEAAIPVSNLTVQSQHNPHCVTFSNSFCWRLTVSETKSIQTVVFCLT